MGDYFQPKHGGSRPRDAAKREERKANFATDLNLFEQLFARLTEMQSMAETGADWKALWSQYKAQHPEAFVAGEERGHQSKLGCTPKTDDRQTVPRKAQPRPVEVATASHAADSRCRDPQRQSWRDRARCDSEPQGRWSKRELSDRGPDASRPSWRQSGSRAPVAQEANRLQRWRASETDSWRKAVSSVTEDSVERERVEKQIDGMKAPVSEGRSTEEQVDVRKTSRSESKPAKKQVEVTRASVSQSKPAEKEEDFTPSQTAGTEELEEKIYQLSLNDTDLAARRGMLGSLRALYDRRKFEGEYDHKALLQRLCEEHRDVYRANPHLRQVFVNGHPFHRAPEALTLQDRLLTPDKGRTAYARRTGEVKTVEHWGQRKLLLSEIEFLTLYANPQDTLIYAGAAPGSHTNIFAAALFPEINFVLVDPANFDAWETDRIKIVKECFGAETARNYAARRQEGEELLFMSDIRSTIPDATPPEEFERRVVMDMEAQAEWTRILRPRAAMLKFRLPYNVKQSPEVDYLDGEVYFPVWGPRTTTECRLIVTNADSSHRWSSLDYESAMYHFNTITRVTYFPHTQSAAGYDHCYDCAAEAFILRTYLDKRHGIHHPEIVCLAVDTLSEMLSRHIGFSRKSLQVAGAQKMYA